MTLRSSNLENQFQTFILMRNVSKVKLVLPWAETGGLWKIELVLNKKRKDSQAEKEMFKEDFNSLEISEEDRT